MMEFLNFVLNDPISQTLAITLLHFLWQGALLAVLLFAGLTTISKKHAELRYLLSLTVLALTLLVPIATFVNLYPEANSMAMQATEPANMSVLMLSSMADTHWAIEHFLPLITPLWLAGILYLSLSFVIELTKVNGLPHDSVIPADDKVQRLFEHVEQRIGVARRSQLLVSMKVDVPMVIGWLKPVVLLPLSMVNGLSTEQLEMLLAHELAHVRRQDYLVNLVQSFVEILLFFHPCVRWISNRVRVEREYCCDDMALKCCGDAKVYATALADAEVLRHGSIPQLAMAATGGDLKSRVLRIIGRHDCAQKYSETWHGIALAGLLAIGLAGFLFVAHEGMQQRIADVSDEKGQRDTTDIAKRSDSQRRKVTFTSDAGTPVSADPVAATTLSETLLQTVPEPQENAFPEEEVPVEVLVASVAVEQPRKQAPLSRNEQVTSSDEPGGETQLSMLASDFIAASGGSSDEAVTDAGQAGVRVQPLRMAPSSMSVPDVGRYELGLYEDQRIYTDIYFRKGLVDDDDLVDDDLQKRAALSASARKYIDKVSPKAMRTPSPSYPVWAAKRNLEGEVLVSFVVSKSGTVENVHFSGDANKYFKRSVELALRKWRFKPGLINGEKTEMAMNKIFTFSDPDRTSVKITGSRLARRI